MRAFTELYRALDRTTRTSGRVAALEDYFRSAPPEDAVWGLYVLAGGRVRRAVSARLLREWAAAESGLPTWLVEESYSAVGDLAETLALLLPGDPPPADLPLHRVMEEWVLPLPSLPEGMKRERVVGAWRQLDPSQRLVFHKLIGGAFRVGVARSLVIRALARVAGIPPGVMAHRLSGEWTPSGEAFRRFLEPGDRDGSPGRPYPFLLAHPLEGDPESLGPPGDWLAEWKWDGIRAQLIRRGGEVLLWSRGEEPLNGAFPEVAEAARDLRDSFVMDGEIIAWKQDRPLSFNHLQRRINRKRVGSRLRAEVPVRYLAWDLLEEGGADLRALPLEERRARLEALLGDPRRRETPGAEADAEVLELPLPGIAPLTPPAGGSGRILQLSPQLPGTRWEDWARVRQEARSRGAEGLMLKRRAGAYGVGRPRGEWWKWKVDPYTVDTVLVYAQRGHGRRAGLYTDYTLGVWDGGELVPVAKAYSGLTDPEIRRVDRWIRAHTLERFGPVRSVEPGLVFELAFDSIRTSSRHRAGVALRFPRIARWRTDLAPSGADTLASLRALLEGGGGESGR